LKKFNRFSHQIGDFCMYYARFGCVYDLNGWFLYVMRAV
jgi:hypothetical protein